jgi:hypothetical protein
LVISPTPDPAPSVGRGESRKNKDVASFARNILVFSIILLGGFHYHIWLMDMKVKFTF